MKLLRRLFRLSRLLLHILWGILLTLGMSGLLRWQYQDAAYRRQVSCWLNKVVRIVGGQVQVHGEAAPEATLMVANHISWLDIPLLGGQAQVNFLSKQEILHWPIIGWLADKSGTLFIQRGGRDAARQATDLIAERLQQRDNILIFPEGTTTRGVDMRHFHARLFASAAESQAQIQPIAINYLNSQGEMNKLVPYVDQQNLLTNLWNILGEAVIAIHVHFLPVMSATGHSRKDLAHYSEQQIREVINTTTR